MKEEIKLIGLNEKELEELSEKMLLALNPKEMKILQKYFSEKKRNPSRAEIETLAQTWSEHCKHKTFNSAVNYKEISLDGKEQEKRIENLFRETIKSATNKISKDKNWLVSVFSDNAGIISFNKEFDVAFKVETHNHPSALDPYGGANTGIGGVIRDILGVGLGAKPIANTDIFCFGEFDSQNVPKELLHPKRIFKGVRAGVRDYGNRMGIPTVNGAIIFDERYLGNPLVYCGTIGLIPKGMDKKQANKGDKIICVGGKTGRDGIHGATFSSIELTEETSATAVQIGNPIEEKKTMDVLLQARDKKLYSCITDCGAGGFSSAIGEMAEDSGAIVHLDKAPLKYKGLNPWEIWISESQERMILAVPKEKTKEFIDLCEKEDVEAVVLGEFTDSKKLEVFFGEEKIIELEMDFLHNALPKKELQAEWKEKKLTEEFVELKDFNQILLQLLGMPNIASKETTIRMYDHEVQAGSVIKPLMGKENDSPSDASVIKPLFDSKEAIAVSNGINPLYGDIDPYWMAGSAIDEAIRNLICVGAQINHIALLDNFCWGAPTKEKMAELVRSATACKDFAVAFGTPFISGKDSFHNEFKLNNKTIFIPSTLLISALGVMPDAMKRISMDLKEKDNLIYLVGATKNELGASHYLKLQNKLGKNVPEVNAEEALKSYQKLSELTLIGEKNSERIIRSMHDCSEGGLAVSIAEMAFGGMLGVQMDLRKMFFEGNEKEKTETVLLFSESNSRIIAEVPYKFKDAFEKKMHGAIFSEIGRTTEKNYLEVTGLKGKKIIDSDLNILKQAWKKTLDW
ncbi:MAG: phosphoribosylformylglycinamidine synthase subunit PurL [Candidatus Diapherotrites archaeon CG10_big_fil_rev_8_21_14_0_10_31_34]|nr:MAG: phosphoribosylformylglycinamidine synthase subunit PurL [Candidatus Diapherotrites archaeon CG10_big_fil_rev_8_21_14_0_10_31_34]